MSDPRSARMEQDCQHLAVENSRLAARLAEVEGKLETAEGEAYYWRSLCSEDDRVEQLQRRLAEVEAERDEAWKFAQERIEKQNVETGKRVDLIHEREAFRAERDRLAQELEDAQTERDGLLMQNDLGGERLREMAAERDRLAQRRVELLEKVQLFAATGQRVTQERDEAIGLLRQAEEGWGDGSFEWRAARDFLARFPREGDEG